MNWEELFSLLTELGDKLGEKVYILPGGDLDTIALDVLPVAWFVAMKHNPP